jgi:hypothetical protein
MSDATHPRSLFAVLVGSGVPLLMGAAAFYFTSGVTLHCERAATGHASCTESRRLFKLIDVPLRRYPEVTGAAVETRQAYDEDGDTYDDQVPVIVTPSGRRDLAPFGSGVALSEIDIVNRLDGFAKNPRPEGLSVGGQRGGLSFFFHVFSSLFIFLGIWNLFDYARSRFRPPQVASWNG